MDPPFTSIKGLSFQCISTCILSEPRISSTDEIDYNRASVYGPVILSWLGPDRLGSLDSPCHSMGLALIRTHTIPVLILLPAVTISV